MKQETPTRRPSSCRKFLPWISELSVMPGHLEAGHLSARKREAAERHLAECRSCAAVARGDQAVILALRRATEIEGTGAEAGTLSPARRRSILDGAAEGGGLGWGLLAYWDLRPSLVAVVAVLLAVVAVTPWPGSSGGPSTDQAEPTLLELQVLADGQTVALRWNGAPGQPRRVVRATDPREIAVQPGEVVYGDHWIDSHENGARVVFYAVE